MADIKNLDDLNFYGKTTLLRADLNSDVVNNKLIQSERIHESSITISELKRRGAKVVILSHQGRPGKNDFISLKQHSSILNKYVKVKFINNPLGEKIAEPIKRLKIGDAILLENIRFEKDEFNPEKGKENKVLSSILPLVDNYVNDSFSVSHRNQASVTLFPKYLKSCAGRLLEKELKALKKIKIKNSLLILGGAKPEDYLPLLKDKAHILSCGIFGQTCMASQGFKFGKQADFLEREVKDFSKTKSKIKRALKNINLETPVDFAVKFNKKRKELDLEKFPNKYEIFDIGSSTINNYLKEIKDTDSIFMKGPAGYCAEKQFCKGTFSILKAIASRRVYSLIGGGHLNDAIKRLGLSKTKFSHISLSGGALISYLAGEKLPGLEALKKSR